MNKTLKKCVISGLVSLSFSGILALCNHQVFATSTSVVEKNGAYEVTTKNYLYENFEKELAVVKHNGELTKEKLFELISKYEGAEKIVRYTDDMYSRASTEGFVENFISGGVNNFAYNRQGIENLRSYYAECSALILVDGTGVGAYLGGPFGAILGAFGGGFLSARLNDARGYMVQWFDVGSHKGGARVTLTESFPIDYKFSINQARIRYIGPESTHLP